jgi:hypothetical protein
METVTLRGEDFKTVHNTLCELREIEMRLNEVISESLAQRLHRVIKGFEAGLARAYEQDNRAFESKMDYYSDFQSQNGLKTIWSIYDLPQHGFLGDHPYKGAAEICYRDHWGEAAVYETILGSTWADLYRAADRCIQRSGDSHHIFIEGFEPVADQPHQLRLVTGS